MSIADLEARLEAFTSRRPSLGALLAANQAHEEDRIRRSAHGDAEARRTAFRKWTVRTRDHIAFAIACGVNPDQTSIPDAVRYGLIDAFHGKSDNQDLWDDLVTWAKEQGLSLSMRMRLGENGNKAHVYAVEVTLL